MRHLRNSLCLAGAFFATAVSGSRLEAQAASDSTPYLKAQEMVSNGEAEAGRKIVDSLVKASPPGSPQYAEGLYWRAALAASARDSEKDYRRIVVDYPLSPRVPDALLRMGELESARGDRQAALQHFQRLTLEHPESPLHAEASYWLAHTYFETNDVQHGCAANTDAITLANPTNVELKNRIAFQQQRCRGVVLAQGGASANGTSAPARSQPSAPTADSAVVAPVPPVPPVASSATRETSSAPKNNSAKVVARPATGTATKVATKTVHNATPSKATKPVARATVRATTNKATTNKATTKRVASHATRVRSSAPAPATPASGSAFAVQVAAFGSKPQAEELAVKLRGRGYDAHVDGSAAPYRVRIGRYSTRAVAVVELQRLKAKQISGFVTPE